MARREVAANLDSEKSFNMQLVNQHGPRVAQFLTPLRVAWLIDVDEETAAEIKQIKYIAGAVYST